MVSQLTRTDNYSYTIINDIPVVSNIDIVYSLPIIDTVFFLIGIAIFIYTIKFKR